MDGAALSFFAQLFSFSTQSEIGEASKKKNFLSRVYVCAYRHNIYSFLFLLFSFNQKKGFGRNALKFRTLGKKRR